MNHQIEQNDILIFKNGMSKLFHENERWILYAFYDENLKCRTDDRYSIVKVMKAEYKKKGDDKVSAKEMFEKLGYKYLYLVGDIIYNNGANKIVFRKDYYDVSLENINLLQPLIVKAINKQISELGWNNEK